MEGVAFAVFLIVAVLLFWLVAVIVKRLGGSSTRKQLAAATWEKHDWSADGITYVEVRKAISVGPRGALVFDVREVRSFPNSADDYDQQLLDARAVADQRASALNSD